MIKIVKALSLPKLVFIITIVAICLASILNYIISIYLDGAFTINDFWRSFLIPLFLAPFIAWPLVKMTYRSIAVETELKRITTYDPLTQVFSRNSFLKKSLTIFNQAKKDNSEFSLMLLDVDFFKRVNDSYGHDAGDFVLAKLGSLFQDVLFKDHLCGRLGGEEFAITMPKMDIKDSEQFAKLIHSKLNNTIIIYHNIEIKITISIGITTFNHDELSFNELIIQADKALYEAKRLGRNQTVLHNVNQTFNAQPQTSS